MSQRWYEIPEEKVALMAERCDQGDSFSKIGRDLGIDRRAVAKAVQQFKDRQSGRAVIRPGVLAQLFREHLDDMKRIARVLLELTASPSLTDSLLPSKPDIKKALAERLPLEFFSPLYRKDAELDLTGRVALRLAQRRGEAAIEGLKEHMPTLEDKIKEWQQSAMGYEKSWDQLEQQAISIGIPSDLIEPSIKLALERVPALGEEESLPRFREQGVVINGPEHFANILLQRPAARRPLQVFWQNLNELEAVCNGLEEMLSPPQLEKSLVIGHCQYCPVP